MDPCIAAPEESPEIEIASTFLSRGQMHLLKGDLEQGLECFATATKLDPTASKLFYAQGLSLFEYGSQEGREKALLLASKQFKMATKLKPNYFDAWLAWGSTLCTLGLVFHEHHYFQEAVEKFDKAIRFSTSQSKDSLAELYWDSGVAYSHLAEHSGEALDVHHAIEAFQQAAHAQDQLPAEFWKDFGHACMTFASKVGDIRFYVKAISHFKHAVSLESTSYHSWFLLAQALEKLYEWTHDEDHFSQSNECFTTAAGLQPSEPDLWLAWGQFLLSSTRRNPDPKRLRMCIEKCQRAHAIDPCIPLSQAIWAEALALLGNTLEKVDLIYDAQNKICNAIDMEDGAPEIWYAYGMCLNACGNYFSDDDYHYQAIEKFQIGLSLNRTCHAHWNAIGNAYTLLGESENDVPTLERSLRFFHKAIDLHPSTFYIFDHAVALFKLGEMSHDQKWYEEAVVQFERALNMQRNAIYLHPHWLFYYACTLDAMGDFHEEEFYYLRAIEIFTHVLMVDPDFHQVHHRLALALSHLGELVKDIDYFFRAVHHYRLSLKHEEENDTVILDWGVSLMDLAQYTSDSADATQFYHDAEHKLMTAAKLGNVQSFYHLSCLYSIQGNHEKAMLLLEKSNEHKALPPLDELLSDEWLESLRMTGDFREFLSRIEHRPNLQEER